MTKRNPILTDEQRDAAIKILLTDTIARHTNSTCWTSETLSDALIRRFHITGMKPEERAKKQ
jgi:hypothetical protein